MLLIVEQVHPGLAAGLAVAATGVDGVVIVDECAVWRIGCYQLGGDSSRGKMGNLYMRSISVR